MAMRNYDDDYSWAMPRRRQGEQHGLHDYRDEPDDPLKLSLKDTLIELATTLGGIVGVFALILALLKIFHPGGIQ